MGTWYGKGGKNTEGPSVRRDYMSMDNDENVAPGSKPCANGVLLESADAPFNGTKMVDSFGRTWGCPGTMDDTSDYVARLPRQRRNALLRKDGTGETIGGTTEVDTSGMWTLSPELQDFYSSLLSRGQEFLGMPTGFSPTAMDYMFGTGFENLRGQEAATRENLLRDLSRSGMLGTGTGTGLLAQNAWNTSSGIAQLMRDLFVQNEQQKKADLLNNTQIAASLFGGGLTVEELIERMNANRRGEANQYFGWLAQLLPMWRG